MSARDPIIETHPATGHWSALQRQRLARAAVATRSQAVAEGAITPAQRVLTYVVARTAPTTVSPADISEATGLHIGVVWEALRSLEASGSVEPGAVESRRVGILTPSVLTVLGLAEHALPLETTPTPRPTGSIIGLSGVALTNAMKEKTA